MKKIFFFSIIGFTTFVLFSSGHWGWGIFSSSVLLLSFIAYIIIIIVKALARGAEDAGELLVKVIVFSIQQADVVIRNAVNLPVEIKQWWEKLPENDKKQIIENAKSVGKLAGVVSRAYGATHRSN
jgi:hypothetical protein